MLEVVGPNADVAELPSIAIRIAATKIRHTPAYDSHVLMFMCFVLLRPRVVPGHSCAPRVCLHNSLPHQSKRRKRPCRAR